MGKLLGLGGYATAGKDEVARRLESHHGWRRHYMSEGLEEALLRLNPWVPIGEEWWSDLEGVEEFVKDFFSTEFVPYKVLHGAVGYDRSKQNTEVRRMLQVLGTEIGRNMCDPEVWLRWAFRQVDEDLAGGFNVAITGMRFPNELQALEGREGVSVWVERPGFGPVNGHASDNTLGKEDFKTILKNDGTLEDLYEKIDNIADLIDLYSFEEQMAA